jgi:hypothetical protein
MIWAAIAFGRSFLGLGTSSARWVTASGVPIVNAPLRTPAKKANPLGHPVLFAQSDHTNELDAWVFGMAAMTIMVASPPTSTTNSPNCCRYGRYLLKNIVAAMQIQVIRRRVTKICQA